MQPIRVVFLGTGDAFSAGGRNQAAILIQHPHVTLLLDCGASTLASLNKNSIPADVIDGILLSHLHGDHFAGLPFLFLHYCYIEPRTRPLTILGPVGQEGRIRQLFQAMYPNDAAEPLPFDLNYAEAQPRRRFNIGILQVEPFLVPHQENPSSLGFTLNLDGRRIVYSGDSGWTDELVTQAQDADLFICECSFYESKSANHLDYPTIKERLANCGHKKMILTHLGREVLERSRELDLKLAYDGAVVML